MPRTHERTAARSRTAHLAQLIVTTREKFPRDARWNRTIRRTLFRWLEAPSHIVSTRRK
ncbi:MAG TPA: hypothetical protein VJ793_05320 [Anaerolineae bacterium]|nr:hypothetical protein [Anaerolineae bacterium]